MPNGFMLTESFDKPNIVLHELKFENGNCNDVLNAVTLKQFGYKEIKARGSIGSSILLGSVRASNNPFLR